MIENYHYWLQNTHVPRCLLAEPEQWESQTREGLCLVDLEITGGVITQILPHRPEERGETTIDRKRGLTFPCFVDLHTHLDKGHIWQRSPNPDGTFDQALATANKDGEMYWQHSEDLYRRMEFGLRCSYGHGTKAIRTHIDCFGQQADVSLEVFRNLQQEWADRMTLQAVCLVDLDYFQTAAGVALADKMAEIGGILGAIVDMSPNLDAQLDTMFALAQERDLNLDVHVDENGDPDSICLQRVAAAALRNQFRRQIICGHCCSLAVQSPAAVAETLKLVQQAGIGIVSLPMCNLYLQDRHGEKTPRWRGITCVQEIKQQGIPVAFASDNCRDPFFAFGDHDVLEVFNQAVRIAHLDQPYQDWPQSVTKTPAQLMGLTQGAEIAAGNRADLILFKARYFSELLSRSQHDRLVLREGKEIDTTLPDYGELDDLVLEKGGSTLTY